MRPMRVRDIDLLWAWRHIPEVITYLPSTPRPLAWEHHEEWFLQAMMGQGTNRLDRIAVLGDVDTGRIVAHVHAADLQSGKGVPEIGVVVGAVDLWHKGIGTHAVRYLIALLKERQYPACVALIHPANHTSRLMFERLGFVDTGETGRADQIIYRKELTS